LRAPDELSAGQPQEENIDEQDGAADQEHHLSLHRHSSAFPHSWSEPIFGW
jgi:hypothetical protein